MKTIKEYLEEKYETLKRSYFDIEDQYKEAKRNYEIAEANYNRLNVGWSPAADTHIAISEVFKAKRTFEEIENRYKTCNSTILKRIIQILNNTEEVKILTKEELENFTFNKNIISIDPISEEGYRSFKKSDTDGHISGYLAGRYLGSPSGALKGNINGSTYEKTDFSKTNYFLIRYTYKLDYIIDEDLVDFKEDFGIGE